MYEINACFSDKLCFLFFAISFRHPTAYTGLGAYLGTKIGASFGGVFGPLGAIFGGAAGYGVSYLASTLTCPADPSQASALPPSRIRGNREQKQDL